MDFDEQVLSAVAGKAASSTGWVRGNCPLCEVRTGKADRNQCLGLHTSSGYWHCFRCGGAGVVAGYDEFDTRATVAPAPQERVQIELPEGHFRLYEEPGWSSYAAEPARVYLRERGIDDPLGVDARIGCVLEGRYRGRVVVPVFDSTEKVLLGWSARAYFPGAERKYLYPTGMRRAEILYNHAALFNGPVDVPLLCVEGVFDALAVWPNGVGFLGKPSPQQVDALFASPRPVVVVLDGDAWREAEALALKLRVLGKRAGWVRLPPKRDPATVDAAALAQAVEVALAKGSAQVTPAERRQ